MAVIVEGVYISQGEEKDVWSLGYGARWERRRDGLWRQEASQTGGGTWECVGEPMGVSDAVRFSLGYDQAEAEEAARSQAALQGPPVGVASGPEAGGVTPWRIVREIPEIRPADWFKGVAEQLAERLEELVTFLGVELHHSEEQPCEGKEATRAAIAHERMLMRWRRKLDRLLSEVCECL